MSRISLLVLTAAALGCSAVAVSGEIYKWTDSDGNVHYEDRPIGEQVERLAVISSSTDDATVQASIDARREREAANAEARKQRAEKAQAAADAAAEKEQRKTLCEESRARMERYLAAHHLYNEDASGERVYLDDDQIMQAREKAQSEIVKYCD